MPGAALPARALSMLRWFERLFDPTARTPTEPPTQGLARFYWHYLRQVRWLIGVLFVTGLAVAALDVTIPVFIGRVVTLVANHTPARLLAEAGPQLLMMALVFLLVRPAALFAQFVVTNQIINPGVTNMIRWQS